MCQYPLSHSPTHLPEGSSRSGLAARNTGGSQCSVAQRKRGRADTVIWLCKQIGQSAKSKDPPIAHWGVHACGQIFGFDGFLANSDNLCISND